MKLITICVFITLLALTSVGHAADTTAPAAPKNVTVTEAAKLVADKKVVVLDVRTEEEFKEGHIPGAKNIDFNGENFAKELEGLDRKQTYLVHCAAGGRSGRSMDTFKRLKFESILHMDAGFNGWKKDGKPVEK